MLDRAHLAGPDTVDFLRGDAAPSDCAFRNKSWGMGVIFGGGYLIRFMTKPLLKHLQVSVSAAQLSNAGMGRSASERFWR